LPEPEGPSIATTRAMVVCGAIVTFLLWAPKSQVVAPQEAQSQQ
jgi:hypothetical protein